MKTFAHSIQLLALASSLVLAAGTAAAAETFRLDQLDISKTEQDWGQPRRNLSIDGNPLKLGGKTFTHGLGTHAASSLELELKGGAERFTAVVGVDDEKKASDASVEFKVLGDGKTLWTSGVLRGGQSKPVDVKLAGVQRVTLQVTDGGDGIDSDHADWADAQFEGCSAKPVALGAEPEEPYILTPKAPATPRINGAQVVGCRPNHPFLFMVPATGERPMTFTAQGLPAGLELDAQTGLITGKVAARGEYKVTLTAQNARGRATRELKIVCGDQIALTPPMGWNSWNCFAGAVTAEKVKAAADAMVNSGLIQHGWTYINIDDFWEKNPAAAPKDPTLGGPGRDAEGRMVPNPRFPDMKGLADYVHGKGLKIGIYSSPGPFTCGGCLGSFDHEALDAQSYAAWGIDYLKYDWCSYKPEMETQRGTKPDFSGMKHYWGEPKEKKLAELMRPYAVMRAALDKVDRDIVYSLCQYGMGDVWEWGGQVGGNCWRTTGDINDSWSSMSGIGFKQNGHEKFAKPGNWNDPDMLVVGKVGWGPALHPTKLTPSEQYTHITLWSLLCAPLLIGCDMTQLDAFTLNLLENDEVIAVNQDPLGQAAGRIAQNGQTEVWAKKMEDGSYAVGLFNRGPVETEVTVNWSDLGLNGTHKVRDLWRQQDLGTFASSYKVSVRRHGAALVRVW
ncbi:MAG TPA: NPCBM/NEW2 domain-containing protein [Verrucomicrobiae bacterium]|nr:NPCBM/NEW2 domain-containing protein [Verrucomicrobiae bacterium]